MEKMIHIAAQYLAAAGISFLDKKDDDSHTNLGFNAQKGQLETWPLNGKGCKIALDYTQFAIHLVTDNTIGLTLSLHGKTHGEMLKLMEKLTTALGTTKKYNYNLHYELPYGKITNDFTFIKPSKEDLDKWLTYRRIAQYAMENIIKAMKLKTTIRVWPHHFDTGGYETINSSKNIAVGFGMAIPDAVVNDFYLYAAGYRDSEGINTSEFDLLTNGTWMNSGFKGAVLPMKKVDEAKAITFFNESIDRYKRL